MTIWDQLGVNQYVGLQPWVWVQLESAEPPGPFPFMGGVAPEVVGSLHEVHGILMSSLRRPSAMCFLTGLHWTIIPATPCSKMPMPKLWRLALD